MNPGTCHDASWNSTTGNKPLLIFGSKKGVVDPSDTSVGSGASVVLKKTVVIVEDQRMIAEFLAIHCGELGLLVLRSCATYKEGLKAIGDTQPDLALLDISLPDGDGLELAKRVSDKWPGIRLLAVSSHQDPWTMHQVQRCGLHGFVDKHEQRTEVLSEAIRAVLKGEVYFVPIASESTSSMPDDSRAFIRLLSDYELRILMMIGEARTDEEIGAVLDISASTVQSRRRDIMQKLDVHSTPKLIHYAIIKGLTRPENLKLGPRGI